MEKAIKKLDTALVKEHIPTGLKTLARLFGEAGVSLYAVGGMVRNPLLGFPISDVDTCSVMRPDDVIALCRAHGIKYVPKGIAYGTVELHMEGLTTEHTTFRSDEYAEGGAHRPESVKFALSPHEDALRRDFTVNAIYLDITSETLLDPVSGICDIERRIIRTTNEDPDAIMRDDALRVLRMARFAAELGFTVADATLASATRNALGLHDISGERVRAELDKLLLSDVRYGQKGGVLKGLELMDECFALDVLLPELARGRGMEQKKEYHAYDVLSHSLHTAAAAPATLELRLAGLLHDVGKPYMCLNTGMMRGHDREGENMAREIMCRLRYPSDMISGVCMLVREHMYDLNGYAKESTLREKFSVMGEADALLLCAIREADVYGSGIIKPPEPVATAVRWREVIARMKAEGAPFGESELNCTGADIMGWLNEGPSPRIGEIKRRLLTHCARWPSDNRYEKLKLLVRGM